MTDCRYFQRFLAAVIAAILVMLSACSPLTDVSSEEATMRGGDDSLSDTVNLREVAVEVQGDQTIVHLNFINGSRNAGVEESKISAVPAYSVTQLYDPPRLQIALAIGFCDYASTGTVFSDSIVEGIFDCSVTESDKRLLVLQLVSPVSVDCKATDSVLTLTLTPRSVPARTAWFVGLNAMRSFENGLIPDVLDFTPTMCKGYNATILISKAFSDRKEAEALKDEAAAVLPVSVPESALYVFEMRTDELPPYESMGSMAIASTIPVIERGGEPEMLPVFIDGGTWLAQTDNGVVYYAKPLAPNYSQDADPNVRMELWQRDPQAQEVQVCPHQFYDIEKAAVSYDGRYVGILDAQFDSQLLYVYDTASEQLINLGEEGLGDYTVSFLFAPDDDIIYAMSGTADALQLLRYNFSSEDEASRVSSVEERNGTESTISYADGRIYFADQEEERICAVDVATGERQILGQGVDCLVSPDGSALAVLQMRMLDAVQAAFDLVLMDPVTGEVTQVVQEDVQVDAFMFGPDSAQLFYSTQANENVTEAYPFALMFFGAAGQSQLLCLSKTERLYTSPDPGTLYLVYGFTMGQETRALRPVTYSLGFAES